MFIIVKQKYISSSNVNIFIIKNPLIYYLITVNLL
jgi:hypothetical protein